MTANLVLELIRFVLQPIDFCSTLTNRFIVTRCHCFEQWYHLSRAEYGHLHVFLYRADWRFSDKLVNPRHNYLLAC
jgi:hypothetical protein